MPDRHSIWLWKTARLKARTLLSDLGVVPSSARLLVGVLDDLAAAKVALQRQERQRLLSDAALESLRLRVAELETAVREAQRWDLEQAKQDVRDASKGKRRSVLA